MLYNYLCDIYAMTGLHTAKRIGALALVAGISASALVPTTLLAATKTGGAVIEAYEVSDSGILASALNMNPEFVDGKQERKLFTRFMDVPSGKHEIGIRVEFSLCNRPYKDLVYLPLTFATGHSYIARGTISREKVEMWIVDKNTNKLISEVITVKRDGCKWFDLSSPAVLRRNRL